MDEFRADPHLRSVTKRDIFEMVAYLNDATADISIALENGIPAVIASQNRIATNLNNLTTIATFFSAVTATTLQMSYQATSTHLDVIVNTFYFASLILSVAAALHSLLGRVWSEAVL
jgi:hypothetical protein